MRKKQSRGNPSEDSLARACVLISLLCGTAPSSGELGPSVSAFVQQSVSDPTESPAVLAAAFVAFEGLRMEVWSGDLLCMFGGFAQSMAHRGRC